MNTKLNDISQFFYLLENKDRFINQLDIDKELKEKYKNFFKSHANLENKIDWQNKDFFEIQNQIEKLMSNTDKAKERRKISSLNYQGKIGWKSHDFAFYKETDQWIYLIPLTHRAGVFADSYESGGEGARWCIGIKDDSFFWDDYVDNKKSVFCLLFNKLATEKNHLKYMVEITQNQEILVWTQINAKYSLETFKEKIEPDLEFTEKDIKMILKIYSAEQEKKRELIKNQILSQPIFNQQIFHSAEEINQFNQLQLTKEKSFALDLTEKIDELIITDANQLKSIEFAGIFENWKAKKIVFAEDIITQPDFFIGLFAYSQVEEIDLSQLKIKTGFFLNFERTFLGCENLKSIKFPYLGNISVRSFILSDTFSRCRQLKKIILSGNIETETLQLDFTFNDLNLNQLQLPSIKVNDFLNLTSTFTNSSISRLDLSNIYLSEDAYISFFSPFFNLTTNRLILPTSNQPKAINKYKIPRSLLNKIDWNGFKLSTNEIDIS